MNKSETGRRGRWLRGIGLALAVMTGSTANALAAAPAGNSAPALAPSPAPADGPASAGVAAGTLQKISVHGASLEGNLAGDDTDRTVYVYLPPGYGQDATRRYPVIYFLHGFGASAEMYLGFLSMPAAADAAIAEGRLPPAIIVMPDALNRFGSSMYSNSPTIGDWEGFIARDLVSYIDAHYRTLPRRESRGLAGHSMGGYGTLRIGMKHPDTFSALYAMSSCCLDPRTVSPSDARLESLRTMADIEAIPVLQRTTIAASASWAPNPRRPPFYMDLPTRDGETQPDVVARYATNALTLLVSQHVPQLRRYTAIKMDIGLQDFLIAGNVALDREMTRLGVPHEYENYEGDHMNKVAERFARHVLPFFARHLAFSDRLPAAAAR